ncbi:hypothetical protein [Winogradskyella thalassocola]|uniref:Uncharacterized protein n=1 Tax=Winogradskyella thalassocola TaxID=262004 RepID=A0A1G8IT62_9FLAO|nr:hypothetical protein [Winogradskyella thalassocola]SDI22012.1 hypothetical protein SAMN04489796_10868 [Winogradskyella thalassocola]
MYKHIIVFLITILSFNCKNDSLKFKNFTSEGATKFASYSICSIIPTEVEYSYRVGNWTFKSSNGHKIAKGKYDTSIIKVDNVGGCTYEYISNSIALENWSFWDENGQIIEPTKRMINLVQPKQTQKTD